MFAHSPNVIRLSRQSVKRYNAPMDFNPLYNFKVNQSGESIEFEVTDDLARCNYANFRINDGCGNEAFGGLSSEDIANGETVVNIDTSKLNPQKSWDVLFTSGYNNTDDLNFCGKGHVDYHVELNSTVIMMSLQGGFGNNSPESNEQPLPSFLSYEDAKANGISEGDKWVALANNTIGAEEGQIIVQPAGV